MYAAAFGHGDIVSLFVIVFKDLRKHLNLQQKNNQGISASQLASRNGHEACVRLLTRDAQLFPSAIDAFPDPKELERAPTPTRRKLSKKESNMKVNSKVLSQREMKYAVNTAKINLLNGRSDSLESIGMSGNEADTESVAVSAAVRNHVKKKPGMLSKPPVRNSKLISVKPPPLFNANKNFPSQGPLKAEREPSPRISSSYQIPSLPKLNLNSSISSTKSDSGAFRAARSRNKSKGSGKYLRRTTSEPRRKSEDGAVLSSSSDDLEGDELQDFLMSSCRSEPWSNSKSGSASSVRLPPIRIHPDFKQRLPCINGKNVREVIDEEHETSASEAEQSKLFKKRQIRKKFSHKTN